MFQKYLKTENAFMSYFLNIIYHYKDDTWSYHMEMYGFALICVLMFNNMLLWNYKKIHHAFGIIASSEIFPNCICWIHTQIHKWYAWIWTLGIEIYVAKYGRDK